MQLHAQHYDTKFQDEIFTCVTILQAVEFPIFLLISAWALQQCSAKVCD